MERSSVCCGLVPSFCEWPALCDAQEKQEGEKSHPGLPCLTQASVCPSGVGCVPNCTVSWATTCSACYDITRAGASLWHGAFVKQVHSVQGSCSRFSVIKCYKKWFIQPAQQKSARAGASVEGAWTKKPRGSDTLAINIPSLRMMVRPNSNIWVWALLAPHRVLSLSPCWFFFFFSQGCSFC